MMVMDRLSTLTDQRLKQTRADDFCRWMTCRVIAHYEKNEGPLEMFRRLWPNSPNLGIVDRAFRSKAAIPAGGAVPSSPWGYDLAGGELGAAFLEYIQPQTIAGRIQRMRRVPFNTPVTRSTAQLSGFWAGNGKPKAVTSGVLDGVTLRPATIAGLFVLSRELFRFSAEGSVEFLRDELAAGLRTFRDTQFIDPSVAAVSDISPASVTNGLVPAHTSTGDVLEDLRELVGAYLAAGGKLETATLVMSSRNAVALALRSGAGGTPLFPNLGVNGGTVGGLPTIASDAVGAYLVLLDAAGIVINDTLGMSFQISQQATLELLDNPTNSSTTPTATSMVSLFQVNSAALKIEQHTNWERLGGAALVDSVDYLVEGSPS